MSKRPSVAQLWHLAERMSRNAQAIRYADKPHQLHKPRKRMLRHLAELNKIRDSWADTFKPSRRLKVPRPPCPCDSGKWWPGQPFYSR